MCNLIHQGNSNNTHINKTVILEHYKSVILNNQFEAVRPNGDDENMLYISINFYAKNPFQIMSTKNGRKHLLLHTLHFTAIINNIL